MKLTVQVDGLRELRDALRSLPQATEKSILRRVAKKALKPFDDAWRAKAPYLTGHLSRSGGIGTKLTRRQASLNRKREDKSYVEMYSGPNDPAAIPQEFGTSDMSAQPYMRPAWQEEQGAVLDVVKNELGDEIDRTAQRLGRASAKFIVRG